MSRLFRNNSTGFSSYAGLTLFFIAYLGIVGLLFAPKDAFISKGIVTSDALFR